MLYPSYDFVLELHEYLMRDLWGETFYGPCRPELLQSAIARPIHAACYEEADGLRQAAYLFQGLLMNHGFRQGNKRTAYATLEWFLSVNHLGSITASDDDVIHFCLNAENDQWSINEIESWLRDNTAL